METDSFLSRLSRQSFVTDQVVHCESLPARDPVYEEVPGGLQDVVNDALRRNGIERLYSHQATAIGLQGVVEGSVVALHLLQLRRQLEPLRGIRGQTQIPT